MQTFLPYPDFKKSAQCLDYRRCGKQRSECIIIINSVLNNAGWKNHSAVKMWSSNLLSLCDYGIEICKEWILKGYKDTCLLKLIELRKIIPQQNNNLPEWFGLEKFHSSHRSNLLRKKPEWYNKFEWTELDNLPYYWPI